MGIVLSGIATLNLTGLTDALMQMVAHGLVAGDTFTPAISMTTVHW
ncbi:MAG: hypothetical protein ABFS39_11770 [Pseudomonadota bacterium]